MELGFVGLGKMGANMVRRLLRSKHRVVVYDLNKDAVNEVVREGAEAVSSIEGFTKSLSPRRVVWVMVPSGDPVQQAVEKFSTLLSKGDVFIDGGNSNYKESIARGKYLEERGIEFIDVGTSGGIWGLANGYCMMIGGTKEAVAIIDPALKTLAPPDGYLHVGPHGAGHYVKMIHNGIEYGMMQSYAEGFDILEHSQYKFDLAKISHLWNQGSVVRSWLLELAARALAEDPKLSTLTGFVQDSGEGRWTVNESIDLAVPAPVITLSLQARFRSRRENTYSDRFLAALRNQFGGHAVKKTS